MYRTLVWFWCVVCVIRFFNRQCWITSHLQIFSYCLLPLIFQYLRIKHLSTINNHLNCNFWPLTLTNVTRSQKTNQQKIWGNDILSYEEKEYTEFENVLILKLNFNKIYDLHISRRTFDKTLFYSMIVSHHTILNKLTSKTPTQKLVFVTIL